VALVKRDEELNLKTHPFNEDLLPDDYFTILIQSVWSQEINSTLSRIREEDAGLWRITFMDLDLELFDIDENKFNLFINQHHPSLG